MRSGASVLPEGTTYYRPALTFVPTTPKATKETIREHWFRQALRATAEADLVCVDPDNGIAPDEKMFHQDGPKFVYMDDLRTFWNRGQSLVVYQHTDRVLGSVQSTAASLRDALCVEPIPLWYHRGTARVFFVLPQPTHRERIEAGTDDMLSGPWSHHFERAGGTDE